MNPTRELNNNSFQTSWSQSSSPSRHPTTKKTKRVRSKQCFHFSSQFYHKVFSITPIYIQAWLHLIRVIQDLLHECVLPERKSIYALCHVPNNAQKMTPEQIIHHFWEDNDSQSSHEDANNHTSNCTLMPVRQGGY